MITDGLSACSPVDATICAESIPDMSLEIFLHCVGKSVVKKGLRGLMGEKDFSTRLNSISKDIYERYRKRYTLPEWLSGMEECARAPRELIQRALESIYPRVRGKADPFTRPILDRPKVRSVVLQYMENVPGIVRAIFRRPSDPEGLTVPPGFSLRGASDMAKFLPVRSTRYRCGDKPVGNWVLVDLLGIGSFGEVWKAEHPTLKGIPAVALKFCHDTELTDFIRHESALLNQIMMLSGSNTGIVKLQQAWLDSDPVCLEYEFVNGGNLCGLMADWQSMPRSRRTALALQMLMRLSRTMIPLHEETPPIVHRDLKPGNILVVFKADGKIDLKITDFGIGGWSPGSGSKVGRKVNNPKGINSTCTPVYASPEQQDGHPPNPADDVHALGVIGIQLLLGDFNRIPAGDWDVELRELGINLPMIAVLRKCLAQKARRFKTARELSKALEAVVEEHSGSQQLLPDLFLPPDSHLTGPPGKEKTPDLWLTKGPSRNRGK